MRFPRNRWQYEQDMLFAFDMGMTMGYGIEHTDLANQEREAMRKFIKSRGFKYTFEELRPYIKGVKKWKNEVVKIAATLIAQIALSRFIMMNA